MDNADKMVRVCGYLRMIERTRLLKNTKEKLQQLVGFSVGSGNGLARKGGKSLFMKDAIFRELAHIVSADSDLVPPLEFIQKQYPGKRIKVYFPPSNFSCDLKDNLTQHNSKPVLMYKNERRFRDAIMPDVVTDGTKRYEMPEKWRPANIVR